MVRELARRQLVRARDRDHAVHAGEALQAHLADALGIADRADRGGELARHHLGVNAARLQALDDGVDLRGRSLGCHYDHHALTSARVFRDRYIVTRSSPITATGNGTITPIGMPRPALIRSASPAPISTIANVTRSTAGSTRTDQWLPSHPPGTEPSRMLPASPKSTLPATTCDSPAAQSRIAAWNTSVPTTRCGESRNKRISPTAINAPLPAEVTPSTNPTETPSATAATLCRRSISIVSRSRSCIRFSSARTSVAAPVRRSAAARIEITASSKSLPSQSSSSVST